MKNTKYLLFIMLFGSLIGSLFLFYNNSLNITEILDENILKNTVSYSELILKNLIYFLIIWFLAFVNIGSLFILLLTFIKGFCFGFTTSIILKIFNTKGFLIILTYLPQAFIYIPFYIFICIKAIEYNKKKDTKTFKAFYYKILIFDLLISIILSFTSLCFK